MRIPSRQAKLLCVLACFFLISPAACKKKAPPGEAAPSKEVGVAKEAMPAKEAVSLTAADIKPIIREAGPSGAMPDRVEVSFQYALFEYKDVGKKASEKTVMTVAPDVAGEIRILSTTQLGFSFKKSPAFETSYTVKLDSVETVSGVLTPPSPGEWTYSFATPKFAFVRMSQQNADFKRKMLQAQLEFSGAVSAADVRGLASFSVGGETVSTPLFENVKPHVVKATMYMKSLLPGADVRFSLKPGLATTIDRKIKAEPAQASFIVAGGEPIEILDVSLQQGPTGFFINVICRDSSSEGEDYFYDPLTHRWWSTSRQCALDPESAKETVRVTPAVKADVVPSRGGFRILGAWRRGAYALRIDAGARSVDGGVLLGAYDWQFTVPARPPQVGFVSEGRYLPRSAWSSLAVRHMNVSKASLSVRRIPIENVLFWLNQQDETATAAVSDLILDNHSLSLSGPPDELATTFVDVAALLPGVDRGLLEITISSGNSRQVRRLMLTGLHLVAKRSARPPDAAWKERVSVWALGADTNEPLSGVNVRLVRPSGYVLARCRTAGAEGCTIEAPAKDVDPTPPFAIVAESGGDATYLKFDDLRIDVSNTSVSGEPYLSDRAYRAAIYSDRGVYRPGETSHLVGIVRDRNHESPPAKMPVVASLLDPRDKEIKRAVLAVNDAGIVSLDVPFGDFAATGRYRFVLSVADKTIGEYDFQIEEFMPERMKVNVSLEKAAYLRKDEIKAGVTARYLFGSVPADHPVELTCELRRSSFTPKENSTFSFGVWRPEGEREQAINLGKVEDTLDEKGSATVACPEEDESVKLEGAAELLASAAVFEAGSGRTTVGRTSAMVHPESYYVGLQTGEMRASAGKAVSVQGVVVDWNGALKKDVREVKIELCHLEQEYNYYEYEEEGGGGSQVLTRAVVDGVSTAKVENGRFTLSFTPSMDAAAFLVRARAGNARTDLKIDGIGQYYAWQPAESRVDRTPRPARPVWLEIEGPARIDAGRPVTVKLKAPFRGRVLFTVETSELSMAEWAQVGAGETSWTFKVDNFVPNVYVGAFLVKDPHIESAEAYMPDRAFGVKSFPVFPAEHSQQITLKAPKEVRSNSRLKVELQIEPASEQAFVTVAAVDEGILSLTGFKSPDPSALLFAKRALGVETYETIGWTLNLPASGPSRSTGGGEEGEGAEPGRVQPVKPVALWSGVVAAGKDGRASVSFDVPLYRGNLRVMAVSADRRRVGSASANVVVRDPIVVQATLPRFLSFGDEIQVPVFVTNLSGEAQKVQVKLSASMLPVPGLKAILEETAPVEVKGPAEKNLSLKNEQAGTIVFKVRAVRPIGAAKINILATAGKIEAVDEADVPLLPAGPRERTVKWIEVAEGKNDLMQHLTGWAPTSESSTFWVTRNPYGESFNHLTYLLRYPYG